MQFLFMTLFAAGIVAADQITKYLTVANIALYQDVEFIPGFLGFTYVQNTGAAFSILSQHTWLLTVVSAVVAVVLIVMLCKGVVRHPFGKTTLSLIIAGAIGNLIDRAVFGFVTDMFRTLFMEFAVFNVADICVVVGGIAFCIYFLFFFDKLEGDPSHTEKGESHGHHPDHR